MAKDITPSLPVNDDEWEFETVSEDFPTRLVFDTIGDTFTGTYLKTEKVVTNEGGFDQFIFERKGERFSVSASQRLRAGMAKVRPNQVVRITYTADIPTGQDNPMRDYTVEIARPRRV